MDAPLTIMVSVYSLMVKNVRKNAVERKPKRSDGYTIEQIVTLAAEASMAYGEYVQKMEEGLV